MIFNFVVQKGRSWGNIVYTLLYNVPSSPQLNLWPARIGVFGKVHGAPCTFIVKQNREKAVSNTKHCK